MARATSPSIAQLRCFVAVGQQQHFGRAARSLGIAQPTLSQTVAALEETLGVQLVERGSKVMLTASGARLLPLAERAVAAVDAVAEAATPDHSYLAGPLRLGVIPTIAPYLLPSLLASLRREAPDLQLQVNEDFTFRLLESLKSGQMDAIIVALPNHVPGLVEVPMYDEDFVLAVPKDSPLGRRKTLPVESLSDAELLLLDDGHCLRDQALDVCQRAGVTPVSSGARAASLSTIVQLVAAGMGVTLLPETAVPTETARPIKVVRFVAPAPGRRVGLVYRATSGRAEEFEDLAEIIRRAVADMPVRPMR